MPRRKTVGKRAWIPATAALMLVAAIGLVRLIADERFRVASGAEGNAPEAPAEASSSPSGSGDPLGVAAKTTRDPEHGGVVVEQNRKPGEIPSQHPESDGTKLLHQTEMPQVLEDATLRNNRARLADLRRQVTDLSPTLSLTDYRIERLQAEIANIEHESALRRAEIVKRSGIWNPQTSHGRLLLDQAFTHQVGSLNPVLASSHPIQPAEQTGLPEPVATTISQSPPIRSSLKDQQ